MKFVFTRREVKEIIIAAIVLSIAFSFAYSDGIFGVKLGALPMFIAFSFIAVGIGFLAHELIGHKLIAQHYGMHAEFRMWPFGLAFAFLTSLFGVVFAAPGAVYISSKIDMWGQEMSLTKKRMGVVSVAGPIVNIVLAGIFFLLNFLNPSDLFAIAIFVNVWLALFNMIPLPPLDGSKVFFWNKKIWLAVFAACIILFVAVTGF